MQWRAGLSLTHTARGKLRTSLGHERALRAYRKALFARDYDDPDEVPGMTWTEYDHPQQDHAWSLYRR